MMGKIGYNHRIILMSSIGVPFILLWQTLSTEVIRIVSSFWELDIALWNKILSIFINLIPHLIIYGLAFLLVWISFAFIFDFTSSITGKALDIADIDNKSYFFNLIYECTDVSTWLIDGLNGTRIYYNCMKYIFIVLSVVYSICDIIIPICAETVYPMLISDMLVVVKVVLIIAGIISYTMVGLLIAQLIFILIMILINIVLSSVYFLLRQKK